VVTISANDGLRLFTNAAVGADGGAAPTDLAPAASATSVADDGSSSIPTLLPDSGAIAVGGSTLDDIFVAPPQWHRPLATNGAFPETRFNGGTYYASGFGTRVNLSAPSDNVAVLAHQCSFPCQPQDAVPVLEGGTSASAPMTAAAAAVLRQVARLTGDDLTPRQVRELLIASGRRLPNPPQADRAITVGPQIDVTAAVETLLARRKVAPAAPEVVRIGVAQRQNVGDLGASFVEGTDRTAVDLTGPLDYNGNPSGQNSVSPLTLSADVIGIAAEHAVRYRWTVGKRVVLSGREPVLRMLPADILEAAGLPLAAQEARVVPVKIEVLQGEETLASASTTLTLSPSSGTYEESLAPEVSPVVTDGDPVRVRYDLSKVTNLNAPQLVLSSVGHWNPATGQVFRTAWSTPLAATAGEVMIPASAFKGGAGLYGVGILLDSTNLTWGEFAPLQVAPARPGRAEGAEELSDIRPPAPELAPADGGAGFGHAGSVTRAAPRFQVRWSVERVAGADGALLEISSPAPTIRFLYSTFQNPNGDRRDANGGDTPSRRHVPLHGARGTATFDALELGLPTSMTYTVRVLATSGGQPIGQASPVSSLTIDDGLPPGGGEVIDFDIAPHGRAAVTVAQSGPQSMPGQFGATIYWYAPRLGTYEGVLTGDVTGATDLHVIGSDASLGRTLVIGLSNIANDEYLEVFGADGSLRSKTHLYLSTDPYLLGARVDPVRHRAAILGWASSDYSDLILPLDLASGKLGGAISADVAAPSKALFNGLDLDQSTGRVFPARIMFGDLCIVMLGGSHVTAVDLDAGTAAPVAQDASCTSGIAADQSGGALHTTIGPVYSFPMFPPGQTQLINERTLATTTPHWLSARGALYPVVDPVNHLLLAGFMAAEDYFYDNSATSAVGVFDLASGRRLALLREFNLLAILAGDNYFAVASRGIQLDPATRTGWTYWPLNSEVQEFSY
ncbi:MAG: S8 family serine peptidase, partial [Gammaproteobacteria bacterium]|nr:S8 family serine peptidase [Gammaproteobacteria bacterium]